MPARGHRFSIYDALEAAGHFDSNPANPFSRDSEGLPLYKGPIQYPKMLYHPEGEERIVTVAEVISTPMGPKEVGEQRELIWKIVENAAEDKAARAEGWHDHPAKAVRVRVEARIKASPQMSEKEKAKLLAQIPNISSGDRIAALEAELKRLQDLKAAEAPEGAEPEEEAA